MIKSLTETNQPIIVSKCVDIIYSNEVNPALILSLRLLYIP